jgi:hypothetical protein
MFCETYAEDASESMQVGVAAIRNIQLRDQGNRVSLDRLRMDIAESFSRSPDYVRKYEDIALKRVADEIHSKNEAYLQDGATPASPSGSEQPSLRLQTTNVFELLGSDRSAQVRVHDFTDNPIPLAGPYIVLDADTHSWINEEGFVDEEILARTITPETTEDVVEHYIMGRNYPGAEIESMAFAPLSGCTLDQVVQMGSYLVPRLKLISPLRHTDVQRLRLFRRASGLRGSPENWITYSHRTATKRSLVGVHFRSTVPSRIWWFQDIPALDVPGTFTQERSLTADLFNYVEHEFFNPPVGPSYGIAWIW